MVHVIRQYNTSERRMTNWGGGMYEKQIFHDGLGPKRDHELITMWTGEIIINKSVGNILWTPSYPQLHIVISDAEFPWLILLLMVLKLKADIITDLNHPECHLSNQG